MDLVQTDAPFDPCANDEWPSQSTPRVQLEQGAAVSESVLMPGVRVGKGAHLRRVIVEEGVHVPAGFRAGFDLTKDRENHTVTDSGITVISRNPASTKPAILQFAFSRARTRTAQIREHADAIQVRA